MGFDMTWAEPSNEDAGRGRTRVGTAAERDATQLRLNIWEMAWVRKVLQAAGVLEWGPAGPIDELAFVEGQERETSEAFIARVGAYLRTITPAVLSNDPPPGRIVAVKLLLNDGQRIAAGECLVLAETLGAFHNPEAVEISRWFREGAARGGVVVH